MEDIRMGNIYEKKYLPEPTRMIHSISRSRITICGIGVLLVVIFFQFIEWYTILLAVLCMIGIGYSLKTIYNRKQYLMDDQGFTFLKNVFKGQIITWRQMTSLTYESSEYRLGNRYDHFVITLEQTDSSSRKEYPFVITANMDIGLVELYLWFIQNGIPTYRMNPVTSTLEQIDFDLEDEEALFEKWTKIEIEIYQADEDEFNNFPFRPIWKPVIFIVNTSLAIIGFIILIGLSYSAFELAFSNDKELAELNTIVRYLIALCSLFFGLYFWIMLWVHGLYLFFGGIFTNNLSDYRTRFGQFLYNRFYRIKK